MQELAEGEIYHGNIHDLPTTFFKYASRTAKNRAKLCHSFSLYLDDVASTEDSFGKSLTKNIATSQSNDHSKEDWPKDVINAYENICISSERLGKQHTGLSLCISQSVARTLHDHARDSSRRIQELETLVCNNII